MWWLPEHINTNMLSFQLDALETLGSFYLKLILTIKMSSLYKSDLLRTPSIPISTLSTVLWLAILWKHQLGSWSCSPRRAILSYDRLHSDLPVLRPSNNSCKACRPFTTCLSIPASERKVIFCSVAIDLLSDRQ